MALIAGPAKDGRFPVRVTLRRASDGAERTFDETLCAEDDADDIDRALFIWREGNFSCDCNRALFFARAAGEPDPPEPPCGDGGFAARIVRADNGEVLHAD